MPEEVEKIVLSVDETDAVQGAKAVDKALTGAEKSAEKLGEATDKAFTKTRQAAGATTTVLDRTRNSSERMLRAFEKKMAFTGLTGIEKVAYERDILMRRVAADAGKVERVREAAAKEIERLGQAQRLEAYNKSLQAAIKGSREAEKANESFSKALSKVNKEAAEAKKSLEAETRAAQAAAFTATERARYGAAGAVERLRIERERELRAAGPQATVQQLQDIAGSYQQRIVAQKKADYEKGLQAAIRGSKQAAAAANEFYRAELKIAEGAKKAADALEQEAIAARKTAAALEERARYRVAGPVERLQIDRAQMLREAGPGATKEQIDSINKSFDTLVRNQEKSNLLARRNQLVQNLRNTGENLDRLANRFLVAGVAAGGAMAWFAKTGAALERTQVAFRNLLGSKAAGDAFFQGLIKYSKESVFSLDEIAQASQRALALGFKPEMAQRVVKASFSAAAAMGQTAQMADRITLALGQMQAKQRVSAEEMNQLSEAGVAGWKALADVAGKTVPEMMKLAEKGMINANVAVEVLTETMIQRFGAIEKEMRTSTTWGRFQQLRNDMVLLANDMRQVFLPIADTFLEWVKEASSYLRGFLIWFRDLPPEVQKAAFSLMGMVTAATLLGKALSTVLKIGADLLELGLFKKGAGALGGLLDKIKGIEVAGARLPALFGLIGTAIVASAIAGFASFHEQLRQLDASWNEWERRRKNQPREQLAFVKQETWTDSSGKVWTREQMDAAIRAQQGATTDKTLAERFRAKILQPEVVDPEKAKRELERLREEIARHEEAARRIREDAEEKVAATAFQRNRQQFEQEMRLHADAVQDKAAKARIVADLERAFSARNAKAAKAAYDEFTKEQIKNAEKVLEKNLDNIERYRDAMLTAEREIAELRIEYNNRTQEMLEERDEFRLEERAGAAERDRQLALAKLNLQAVGDLTVEQKIAVEEQKLAIEKEYMEKSLQIEIEKLNRQENAAISAARVLYVNREELKQRMAAITALYDAQRIELRKKNDADLEEKRVEVVTKSNEIIYDSQKQMYERIRSSASSLLDQLLSRTKTWGDMMKAILKAAILTPLKEAAASMIATMMTGHMPARSGGRAAGGWLSSLGGLFGGSQGGWPGTPPFLPGPSGIPGVTPGVTGGGVAMGGATGAAGGAGSLSGLGAGFAAYGKNAVGLLRSLGNLGMKVDVLGNKLGSIPGTAGTNATGVGGVAGGAMLLGGGTLVAMGLQRGGWSGVGMTTAGGALIGAKFGGPIGAVVGAGVGFVAGLIRLGRKSAAEKTIEKVRKAYGITIDKNLAGVLVKLAKESYGGNIDIAIRSPQAREMIQLYSISTGQNPTGMPRPMYGVTWEQSGGGLALQPVYSNGQIVANPYTGQTTTQWSAPQPNVFVQLDPAQANTLLEGRVVQVIESNPGAVSNAATKATEGGTNRNAGRAALMEPLTTMA